MAYNNWAIGEPNNWDGDDRIVFFGHGTLVTGAPTWNDVPGASLMRGYIIEYNQAPDSPTLSIHRTATNTVIIFWPATASNWVLESTNALPQVHVSWPQILPPYQTNGANLQFTEPLPVGNKFYRLRKPPPS